MKNLVIKTLPLFITLMLLLVPHFAEVHAVNFTGGLVNCEGYLTPEDQAAGVKKCDFNGLIGEIVYLIDWMIGIGTVLATGVFAYAGVLFMTANEGNIKKAKGIFSKVLWGFAIMLSAWLIVHTILTALVKPELGFSTLLGK